VHKSIQALFQIVGGQKTLSPTCDKHIRKLMSEVRISKMSMCETELERTECQICQKQCVWRNGLLAIGHWSN
jgi:hypothetical protein